MTNPTPHGQVPEALRLADALEYCDASVARQAINELRRQHARIAELEAEIAAVGAGGVQALSAAPEAIAKLRHLYQNMVNGAVRDTASAKRIAEGLLAPAIEALERATPPAEQQAEPGAVYAELPAPTASIGTDDAWHEAAMRDFADRTHALRKQDTELIRQLVEALDGAIAITMGKIDLRNAAIAAARERLGGQHGTDT